jgi:hypothetical protein
MNNSHKVCIDANFELERALENDILSMRQIGSKEIKDKEGENGERGGA